MGAARQCLARAVLVGAATPRPAIRSVAITGIDPVSLLGLITFPAADCPGRTLRRQCAAIMNCVAVMRGCVLGSQRRNPKDFRSNFSPTPKLSPHKKPKPHKRKPTLTPIQRPAASVAAVVIVSPRDFTTALTFLPEVQIEIQQLDAIEIFFGNAEEITSAVYQPRRRSLLMSRGARHRNNDRREKTTRPRFQFQKIEPTATHYAFDMANHTTTRPQCF